jgi:hypothetical protein
MISPESLLRKLWDSLALLNIYAMLVVVPLEIGGQAAEASPGEYGVGTGAIGGMWANPESNRPPSHMRV